MSRKSIRFKYYIASGKSILILLCLCGMICFSGCQKAIFVIHAYDGEHLPEEQLARITREERERTTMDVLFSAYPCGITIAAVDDVDPCDYQEGFMVFPNEVLVLPGTHTFGIRFRGPGAVQQGIIPALIAGAIEEAKYGKLGTELSFDTQIGHVYKIGFKETKEPWKGIVSVDYWVEDLNTDTVVVGQKPMEESEDQDEKEK